MTRTTFPIHDPDITSVPWALMVPHGAASLVNYGLTLAQLADRGGVTPAEAVALIEDRPFTVMGLHTARDQLREYARGVEVPALATAVYRCTCGLDIKNDAIVSNTEWARISPTGDEGGFLCASCMVDRLGYAAARIVDAHGPLTEALELARLMRDQNLHNRYHFNKLIALLERA